MKAVEAALFVALGIFLERKVISQQKGLSKLLAKAGELEAEEPKPKRKKKRDAPAELPEPAAVQQEYEVVRLREVPKEPEESKPRLRLAARHDDEEEDAPPKLWASVEDKPRRRKAR